jgi:aspartate/tyrosine/aromatic aminotransferase
MIFEQAGFTDVKKYRYWHADTRSLDFNGMCEDLAVRRAF